MSDLIPPDISSAPGWIALVVTLYKSVIGQHGKRLDRLENTIPMLQSKADAEKERSELRADFQRLEDNLGQKMDNLTNIFLKSK